MVAKHTIRLPVAYAHGDDVESDPDKYMKGMRPKLVIRKAAQIRAARQRPSILWAEIRRANIGQVFRTRHILPGRDYPAGNYIGVTRFVPVSRLVKTEAGQSPERVREYMERRQSSNPSPIQVLAAKDGRFYIVNGHHRSMAAARLGLKRIKAVVWRRSED